MPEMWEDKILPTRFDEKHVISRLSLYYKIERQPLCVCRPPRSGWEKQSAGRMPWESRQAPRSGREKQTAGRMPRESRQAPRPGREKQTAGRTPRERAAKRPGAFTRVQTSHFILHLLDEKSSAFYRNCGGTGADFRDS